MNKIVIFDGFRTVESFGKVENIHDSTHNGVTRLGGWVVYAGRMLYVEKVNTEWWGRTT